MTIPKNSQSGFTLVELLIVIAVIGTLVAMLMPAINSARERGRQTVCASRMQQIGIALTKANANKRGKMRTVDGTPMNILDPTLLQPDPQGTEQWQKDGTLSA
ncbi:MAG: prepilin-type N-terminal cleavage/methylation domain-containing protein, partial [Pirellulales bacterium]|nr:prepilin-type N-terminal cleavage/methylation domain-containing protein [Pirellulales bacterium]